MRIGRRFLIISFMIFMILKPSGPAESKTAVDHSIYADLLRKYVNNGMVDYAGFKAEENRLDTYLKVLEQIDPGKLNRNEQFAFYLNAYNAWTIKLILSGYPGIKSIKDLGSIFRSPWKKKFVQINRDTITLDDIEHNILRPKYKDPRIHFSVNCASLSCPPLITEPYRGAILDKQLDSATIAFLNNPDRNRLDGDTLYVSRIFKWYSEDFNNDVYGFFLNYANDSLREQLMAKRDDIKIEYLEYNWSLNEK